MAVSLKDMAQQFATALSHCKALNMRMDLVEDARAIMSMPYDERLIGDPAVPAIHGGATAAFLETTAIIELAWADIWAKIEGRKLSGAEIAGLPLPSLPKTIDFTTDYLSVGHPRDVYARARINCSGRRYASVHVEAWQDKRSKLVAQATGHFLMPSSDD